MRKRLGSVSLILLWLTGAVLMLYGAYSLAFAEEEGVVPLEVPEQVTLEPSIALPDAPQEEIAIPAWTSCEGPGKPLEGNSTPLVDTCEEPAPSVSQPHHIQIDAIDVDHPIINVGINDDGTMEIPHDVNELGWYEPGVMPGEYGSSVIAGHVDSREQGPGAFFDLRYLEAEDEIIITDEEGVAQTWIVNRITRYDKDEAPLEELFRWDGPTRDLVLITCGGEFDQTARSYQDNIVVYGSLVEQE